LAKTNQADDRHFSHTIAFMDESGDSHATSFVALAGITAKDAAWSRFEQQWNEMLRRFEISVLHMREFAHGRGEFSGWSESWRRALLSAALDAILNTGGTVIGAAVSVAGFKRLPPNKQTMLQDPYFTCAQAFLRAGVVDAIVDDHGGRVSFVFADHPEFGSRARKLVEAVRRLTDQGKAIDGLRVGDPRQELALQAADLVAYEIRKFCDTHPPGKTPQFRWPLAQLMKLEHVLPYHDEEELQAIFRRNNAGSRRLMLSADGIQPWDPIAAARRLGLL
jgi:hypothetical protein